MIARQQQLITVAAGSNRVPIANAEMLWTDVLQAIPGASVQTPDYMQLLQIMNTMRAAGQFQNNQPRPNKPIQKRPVPSSQCHPQHQTVALDLRLSVAGAVPVQARPATNGKRSDVILLDSDEETATDDVQTTVPK